MNSLAGRTFVCHKGSNVTGVSAADKIGKGHVTTIIPMVFSVDETTDIGRERVIVMFFHDGPGPDRNVKRINHERSQ